MKVSKVKGWVTAVTTLLVLAQVKGMAMASTPGGVTNPFQPTAGASAGSIMTTGLSWLVHAVEAIAGGIFLFNLYMAISKFATHSHNAQKREEARSHVLWALGSGVLLGGAILFASAAYNFGSGL